MAIQQNILDTKFIKELSDTTSNLYRLGWHERNSGNISYILNEDEITPYLDVNNVIRKIDIPFAAGELAGKFLLVTGSGKYFKNVANDPEDNLGVIRVSQDGKSLDLLWGLRDGGVPTSELPTHFLSHIARLRVDPNHRIVMHCHCTNLLAMTFVHSLDENAFTKTLWQVCTESVVVFPDGVGLLPWMVCGTDTIGKATADKMLKSRVVIWAHHGVFGTGTSLDETFGLLETVEKSAQIYMMIQSTRGAQQVISDQQLLALADRFSVEPREGVLKG